MPRIGNDVVTATGRGRVIGQEILSRQLVVQMEDNRRVMIHAEEVLSVIRRQEAVDRADSDERVDDDVYPDSEEV